MHRPSSACLTEDVLSQLCHRCAAFEPRGWHRGIFIIDFVVASCQLTRDLRVSKRHDHRGEGEASDTESSHGVADASGKGRIGRWSMKR